MIDLLKFSPYTYGSRSRDYQAIARAENGVYNFAKMSTDSMANSMLYENTDDPVLLHPCEQNPHDLSICLILWYFI